MASMTKYMHKRYCVYRAFTVCLRCRRKELQNKGAAKQRTPCRVAVSVQTRPERGGTQGGRVVMFKPVICASIHETANVYGVECCAIWRAPVPVTPDPVCCSQCLLQADNAPKQVYKIVISLQSRNQASRHDVFLGFQAGPWPSKLAQALSRNQSVRSDLQPFIIFIWHLPRS